MNNQEKYMANTVSKKKRNWRKPNQIEMLILIKLTTYNIKQVYKMSISKLVRKDMEVNEDERLLSKFRHILK